MPLLLQKNIGAQTKLAVWKIEEPEAFFSETVHLNQEIKHPHKRLQHLAGRYILSLLFADFPFREILVNKAGKPYLLSNQYQFSVSHCADYAAAIISAEKQCGIDIELFSFKTELVKHKYLSYDELFYLDSLQKKQDLFPNQYALYTICWCAKEAVYKWWGKGKIDFKKNMQIQNIDIENQCIEVSFAAASFEVLLSINMVLFQQLSIVWTATAKIY